MSGGQDPAAMQTDHKEKDTDVASGISSRHRLLNGNSLCMMFNIGSCLPVDFGVGKYFV